MKKKTRKMLMIGILGLLFLVIGGLIVINNTHKISEVNCFPEGTYLCNNSTLVNGFFYCNIDDTVKCQNGCIVTKFGDDFCKK
jgi:hypothetical protein